MTSRAEHEQRREAVYLAAQLLQASTTVRFTAIDGTACGAFRSDWVGNTARRLRPGATEYWDWHDLAKKYYRSHWARLELAMWSGSTLCGLALGRFSRAETVLQLNFIEGAPGVHPLKRDVLRLGFEFGERLGIAYGSKAFRVTAPETYVINALQSEGYSYVQSSKKAPYYPYCERMLP